MNNKGNLTFQNSSIEELTSKEWIITNGIGGYASSTICGINTRKYHGLLVAAFNPPTDRRVIVSKIEDAVKIGNELIELSSNQYVDVVHPSGYKNLKKFSREGNPKFTFKHKDIVIEKEICMIYGTNSTIVSYSNKTNKSLELFVNPLFTERDFHSVSRKSDHFNFYFKEEENFLKLYAKGDSLPLFIKYSPGKFNQQRAWYNNFQYFEERDRGMDYSEDLFSIGTITIPILAGQTAYVLFSLEDKHLNENPEVFFQQEKERQKSLHIQSIKNEWTKDLIISGNQFIVKRNSTNSYSIIAGYHWFSDWGRDTMIAIRGLCIVQGRQEEAKSIIQTFLNYLSNGMLPNRFPDYGEEPEYNTVDATLWLFIALYEYYKAFQDVEFIRNTLPQLIDIIDWYRKGTRFNIHLTEEGLIFSGDSNSQLTWMDAKCNGKAMTPRHGCAVEINALWYNALRITNFFTKELNIKKSPFDELITRFEGNFKKIFYNESKYLNDVVIPGLFVDKSNRPNQIIALSLPYRILENAEELSILKKVQDELFTPLGLRTLNPSHPDFKKVYFGDVFCRDSAYHQGTVWPFLLGEFYTAYLRLHNYSKDARKFVQTHLSALEYHFYNDSCIYGISEIFDGGKPNKGRGTIHQAWSVSAIIKTIVDNKIFEF